MVGGKKLFSSYLHQYLENGISYYPKIEFSDNFLEFHRFSRQQELNE